MDATARDEKKCDVELARVLEFVESGRRLKRKSGEVGEKMHHTLHGNGEEGDDLRDRQHRVEGERSDCQMVQAEQSLRRNHRD
mgnify:CR=1 FL=1